MRSLAAQTLYEYLFVPVASASVTRGGASLPSFYTIIFLLRPLSAREHPGTEQPREPHQIRRPFYNPKWWNRFCSLKSMQDPEDWSKTRQRLYAKLWRFDWYHSRPRRLIRSSRPTEIFQPPQQGFFSVHAQLQLLGKIFKLFTPHLRLYTHKKYNKIFIKYKEIQQRSGAKSYVTNE